MYRGLSLLVIKLPIEVMVLLVWMIGFVTVRLCIIKIMGTYYTRFINKLFNDILVTVL